MSETSAKVCTKCCRALPTSEFYAYGRGPRTGRLHAKCKECQKAKTRAYYAADPEAGKARSRASEAKNPERVRRHAREAYHRNPETYKAYVRRWQSANMDKVRTYKQLNEHARRAIEREGTLTLAEHRDLKVRAAAFGCVYCGGPFEHLDHATPLAKGGRHDLSNLVPACARCNTQKNASTAEMFGQRLGVASDVLKKIDAFVATQ